MGTLACCSRVMTTAAAGDYPGADAWRKRSIAYLEANVEPLISEDGSRISCPSYLGASIEQTLMMALVLKNTGTYDAFRQDERLRHFGRFMLDTIPPPDVRYPVKGAPEGTYRRALWQLGDTSMGLSNGIIPYLTMAYKGVDDQLAGEARQMMEWMGYPAGGAYPTALLSDMTLKPINPDLHSVWYPGYCVIARDGLPHETWIGYRQTKYAVDHFHADQGSFTLYAKGVPLMLDWGSMYSPCAYQGIYHNRLTWDVKEGDPRPCPGEGGPGCYYQGLQHFAHKFEPWTAKSEMFGDGMGPQDSFGEVKQVTILPTADFLQGQSDIKYLINDPYYPDTPLSLAPVTSGHVDKCDPFSWQRRLLFAKAQNESEPSWLLVRDDLLGPCPPPTASFWVMAKDLSFTGNQAHATGQFGVDLDLYVAQPARAASAPTTPPGLDRIGHRNAPCQGSLPRRRGRAASRNGLRTLAAHGHSPRRQQGAPARASGEATRGQKEDRFPPSIWRVPWQQIPRQVPRCATISFLSPLAPKNRRAHSRRSASCPQCKEQMPGRTARSGPSARGGGRSCENLQILGVAPA